MIVWTEAVFCSNLLQPAVIWSIDKEATSLFPALIAELVMLDRAVIATISIAENLTLTFSMAPLKPLIFTFPDSASIF